METNSHNSICRVERLFDAVSVMNVDVDVKNSVVIAGNHVRFRISAAELERQCAYRRSSSIPSTMSNEGGININASTDSIVMGNGTNH